MCLWGKNILNHSINMGTSYAVKNVKFRFSSSNQKYVDCLHINDSDEDYNIKNKWQMFDLIILLTYIPIYLYIVCKTIQVCTMIRMRRKK